MAERRSGKAPEDVASGSGGGRGMTGSEANLEDRFSGLNLHEEEEEELDLSGEIEGLIEETRWIAIFRVHTTKPFSHIALYKAMRNAWAPAQGVIFKDKKPNIFLAQFLCIGDWNRVMNGGPWLFRNAAVVLEENDGLSNVEEYKLDRIAVWACIIGIPDGLMKKTEIAEKIAKKVGIPPIKVIVNEGRINPAKYLRARVHIMLDTPIVRFVPLTLKESKRYPVEYEKLPDFCDFCVLIGHLVTECGDGLHHPEDCEWGDWLLVNYDDPSGGSGSGRGRANMGRPRGRDGGLDREQVDPEDPNPKGQNDMELDRRMNNQGAVVPMAKKRLIGDDGSVTSNGGREVLTPPPGFVNERVGLLESGRSDRVDKSQMSTPEKIHDPKRLRANSSAANPQVDASATPLVGDRREQ
ncbi:hypothetical protein VPH35_037413 [Triticum aestivum]